jgi:glycosyltransferase involved in cell wall biosynthesis
MKNIVSVIIPVYNDLERLKICLNNLENQTVIQENYEIIVVDNGSDINIDNFKNLFPKVKFAYEAIPGSYAARNRGILLAQGDILAFTDSDCIPAKDWIENGMKKLLTLPENAILAGKINMFYKDSQHPNSVEIYDSITHLQQDKIVKKAYFAATANLFTYKKVFESVGLFNSELKSGGDAEWGKKAYSYGCSIIYADNCCVAHPCRYTLSSIFKKVTRISGGLHARKKLSSNNHNRHIRYIKSILRLRPPLIYAYKKTFLEPKVKSNRQKLEVFMIILLVFYRKKWEAMILNFGQTAKR